uniref:Protein yippee-like 1 n=1 Tax=Aceria tosichella TaxID=561515 RepID=A0A6G1S6B7_9ACAR
MAVRLNRGQQTTRSSGSISSPRDANNSSSSSASTSKKGTNTMRFVQKYLDECRSFYSCIYCRTHLANHDELISRSFQGNRSRAYLFNSVINVSCGPSVQRELNTGSHSVADIFCTNCGTTIGWKYEKAFVDSQKYKEGKFIIELAHVVRENRHLELDKRDIFLGLASAPSKQSSSLSQACTTTIGTTNNNNHHHGGSLSPVSSGGQWSPGSSSSSSSSSSSNDDATSRLTGRYATGQDSRDRPQMRCADDNHDDDDDDEIEDDEVLMFPFYDDLYGNRSSYSNLSTSRSYQKRLRRSLYLDAAPYDWKYSGCSSSSSVSPTATKAPPTASQQQPELSSNSPTYSSGSIEIPSGQAGQAQSDNCSRQHSQQLASTRRFFASTSSAAGEPSTSSSSSPIVTFPPQPTSSSTLSAGGRCDTENNSELALNRGTSSSSSSSSGNEADFNNHEHDADDHDDTQFKFELDKQPTSVAINESSASSSSSSHNQASTLVSQNCDQLNNSTQLATNFEHYPPSGSSNDDDESCSSVAHKNAKQLAIGKQLSNVSIDAKSSNEEEEGPNSCDKPTTVDVNSEVAPSVSQSIPRANSLSFDDEEFYDCNTDHDVSNLSLKSK